MVATIPPVQIERPAFESRLRYGLFQAAAGPFENTDLHFRNGGIEYRHTMCGPGYGYEVECGTFPGTAKTFDDGISTVLGVPFIVYATFNCGSVGYTQAEFQQMGVAKLKSVEQSIVETVFSSGTFAQAPSLANNPDVVTVVGGGTTSGQVLSELETAFYCTEGYGYPATVHVPIAVFNDLKERHLIEWDGLRWRTPMGSTVSSGCYANLDPAGAAPLAGTFWMYITGQTGIWRTPDSQLFVAPVEGSLDRTTNQQKMLVEREYVVAFECTPYAKAVVLWT